MLLDGWAGPHLPFLLRDVEAGVGDEAGERFVGQVEDKSRLVRSSHHEQIRLIGAPSEGKGVTLHVLEYLGILCSRLSSAHEESRSMLRSVQHTQRRRAAQTARATQLVVLRLARQQRAAQRELRNDAAE